LSPRFRTALVALPVFLAALFFLPQIWWALFLVPWLLIGASEWAVLAKWPARFRTAYAMLMMVACGLLWITVVAPSHGVASSAIYATAMVFWLVVVPTWLAFKWQASHPLVLALTGLTVLLPLWLALVELQDRPHLLLTLLAILWISDTAAFLCGKRWGKHKLAPSVSPGKTWEGVAGALIAVTLYYAVVSTTFEPGAMVFHGLGGWMVFLALTFLGVEGDLFESWVKRTAGVKDSGTVLPGHGGVLDRVDALTSSMPAAALLLVWLA